MAGLPPIGGPQTSFAPAGPAPAGPGADPLAALGLGGGAPAPAAPPAPPAFAGSQLDTHA